MPLPTTTRRVSELDPTTTPADTDVLLVEGSVETSKITVANLRTAMQSNLVAGVVVYDNSTSGLTATDVQAAIDELAANPGITDHGDLEGLSDDDHPQYLLVDGSRAMSGALQLVAGSLGAPGLAFTSEPDSGIYRPAADQLGIVVSGVLVATATAPSGANPQLLLASGTASFPALSFEGDPDTGLFRPSANAICIAINGAERWRISGSTFAASTNGNTISQSVANGGLNIQCNLTTATDDRVGISVANVSSPAISTGSLRLAEVRFPINMSGTAGYTVLDVIANETATGSGDKWLIGAKSGSGGTTRVFGVANDGRVLVGDGTAAAPSYSFLALPTSGFYRDGANIAWTVASTKRGEFSSTGIAWANNSNFVVSNGANNRSLTLTGRYNTGAGPSVILNNAVNFVASAATEQTLVSAQINVAQAGSGGYTVLNIQATETSLGSGEKYLIRAKSGPANEQRFAVDYRGNIIFSTTRKLQDHTTSPEGAVTAPVGSIVVVEDTSVPMNNGVWAKYAGSGSSGWNKLNHVNPLEVYGFEDFDRSASEWIFDIGVNAQAIQLSNGAAFGFPSSGVAVFITTAASSNGANAVLPTAGMALDSNAPIVTEWKFLPFSQTETAPTAPGSTSALTASSSAGSRQISGVPTLTGEGPAPFWIELDNGVDPAETRRVRYRAGTTLYIDSQLTYSYAPGDTAAYAGPADQSLVYANDEFTWLMGLGGGNEQASPLVVFGGIWDNGSSTMTNAIAMQINGSLVTETFTMPSLTAAYYRAKLTVAETQVVLEMADGEGPYSVVATYSGSVDPVVYFPFFAASDGSDTRGLAVDWVRWSGLRAADNTIGTTQGEILPNVGVYIPTFTTTGGGTTPSMVGGTWTWTRVGKILTVSGRFSSVDDAGVPTDYLYATVPFFTRTNSSAIGSCVGRDFSGNPYVCLVTADSSNGGRVRIENFPYDSTAAVEWWITFTYVYKS